jgi:hypothetical protein
VETPSAFLLRVAGGVSEAVPEAFELYDLFSALEYLLAYHRVRSRTSLIAGTNGHSGGIVPWWRRLLSA